MFTLARVALTGYAWFLSEAAEMAWDLLEDWFPEDIEEEL
jgi:hypothetical protein